jgi:hypothetical protein
MDAQQFPSNNKFKHLIMTLVVETSNVVWRGETFKANNF